MKFYLEFDRVCIAMPYFRGVCTLTEMWTSGSQQGGLGQNEGVRLLWQSGLVWDAQNQQRGRGFYEVGWGGYGRSSTSNYD